MTKEEMAKKIEELKAAQEKFLAEANMQLGRFQGQIALLEELLKQEAPADG